MTTLIEVRRSDKGYAVRTFNGKSVTSGWVCHDDAELMITVRNLAQALEVTLREKPKAAKVDKG